MNAKQIHQAIDSLDSERNALAVAPSCDFMSCDVPDRLQTRVAELAALPIPARFVRERAERETVIANSRDLIARWRELRGASVRAKSKGCCGR
jgi:hypothetical protein